MSIQKRIEKLEKELAELKESLKEESKYFDLSKLPEIAFTDEQAEAAGFDSEYFFRVRTYGEYRHKAFYLEDKYNWRIKTDSDGVLCLIPTRK